VRQIQQAQQTGGTLYIPPSLVIPLWYYTCISRNVVSLESSDVPAQQSPITQVDDDQLTQAGTLQWLPQFYLTLLLNVTKLIINKSFRQEISIQAAFTFNSYYQLESEQSPKIAEPVLQSNIILNGDIFHKIQKEFLKTDPNCATVISAHYWLTAQVLSYFRNNLNLFVWEIAAVVPAGFLALNLVRHNLLSSFLVWVGATLPIALIIAFSRPLVVKALQRVTTINSQNLDDWAWRLICIISSMIVGGMQVSLLMPLLSLVLSMLTPKILKPILSFIWPHLGKLIGRLLSRLPF
jgi:hypothetical protein